MYCMNELESQTLCYLHCLACTIYGNVIRSRYSLQQRFPFSVFVLWNVVIVLFICFHSSHFCSLKIFFPSRLLIFLLSASVDVCEKKKKNNSRSERENETEAGEKEMSEIAREREREWAVCVCVCVCVCACERKQQCFDSSVEAVCFVIYHLESLLVSAHTS